MLKYWIWLTQRKGLGPRRIVALLRYFGTVEAVYLASEVEYAQVEELDRSCIAPLMEKDLSDAERVLEQCYRKRVNLLTIQDAGYPQRLKNIPDPPALLYYRGRVPAVDEEPTVAVVGTRKCSPYGLLCAKRFGFHLAGCGCTVVSGGARGIDTMALRGALSAARPVIAVLGCGVDVTYPPENESLFRDIEANGWLVSEYPPSSPPEGRNFPVRNRIISGLSLGVLVVEAGERSGALITAGLALEQGRDVFAIPGNIDVAGNKGTNSLLKEGAIVADCGWDVAREYAPLFPDKIRNFRSSRQLTVTAAETEAAQAFAQAEVASPTVGKQPPEKKSVDNPAPATYIDIQELLAGLNDEEQQIVQLLREGAVHVDEIIARSGKPAPMVLSTLTMLEVKHCIKRHPGKYFSLAGAQ